MSSYFSALNKMKPIYISLACAEALITVSEVVAINTSYVGAAASNDLNAVLSSSEIYS